VQEIPVEFELLPNYPNPFNATTSIVFHLPDPSQVHLCVYNLSGEIVATLVDERLRAGVYQVSWNAKDRYGASVPSGLYICRMATPSYHSAQMLLYMK
jgi:flagellar hook assembly protein FlgD